MPKINVANRVLLVMKSSFAHNYFWKMSSPALLKNLAGHIRSRMFPSKHPQLLLCGYKENKLITLLPILLLFRSFL